MNYPVWYLPTIGGGVLIALIAITHVFVSHFAVGGGLYLVFAEKKAYRENDDGILGFVKTHARFFLLITMVYGSITGVGIWFIIALVNPAGTSLLIHHFVFGWATEWVFFVLEITAAFVYFYTFGRMDRDTHLKIGWIYFISAWMSLLLITGIVDVMLTPGNWVTNRNFWVGFFNPSFVPSVFFRTFLATLMAGAYGYLTAAFTTDDTVRHTMTRFSAKWTLVSLVLAVPSGYWYVAALPAQAGKLVAGASPTIATAREWGLWSAIVILLLSLVAGIMKPSWNRKPLAVLAFICAFLVIGAFEWTREAARRPYVINEVMYTNSILKTDMDRLKETGYLSQAKWVQHRAVPADDAAAAGKELFIHQCYACHTLGGFNNDIVSRTANMSYNALVKYIQRIHEVRYFMPPFAGTPDEARALAAFIAGELHGKPVEEPKPLSGGLNRGGLLFEENCSSCHGIDDMTEKLEDWDRPSIREALDKLNELVEDMPPYDGTTEEKDLLALFLYSLNHPVATPGISGKAVFADNCTACHETDDMADLVSHWDREDIREALDKLDELVEEMPPFEGTPQEKNALADYLNSLKGGDQ